MSKESLYQIIETSKSIEKSILRIEKLLENITANERLILHLDSRLESMEYQRQVDDGLKF